MQRRRLIDYPTAERAKDTHREVQGQNKNSIINHEVILLLWLDGGEKLSFKVFLTQKCSIKYLQRTIYIDLAMFA